MAKEHPLLIILSFLVASKLHYKIRSPLPDFQLAMDSLVQIPFTKSIPIRSNRIYIVIKKISKHWIMINPRILGISPYEIASITP